MGAASPESPWSARERDQYKLWREIRFWVLVQLKHPLLESQLIALISSSLTMVRTKADSVPGTYRKGEVVELGGGGQGVLRAARLRAGEARALHRSVSQTGPAVLEAAAWRLYQEEGEARTGDGCPAVLDRGALLPSAGSGTGENVALRLGVGILLRCFECSPLPLRSGGFASPQEGAWFLHFCH